MNYLSMEQYERLLSNLGNPKVTFSLFDLFGFFWIVKSYKNKLSFYFVNKFREFLFNYHEALHEDEVVRLIVGIVTLMALISIHEGIATRNRLILITGIIYFMFPLFSLGLLIIGRVKRRFKRILH